MKVDIATHKHDELEKVGPVANGKQDWRIYINFKEEPYGDTGYSKWISNFLELTLDEGREPDTITAVKEYKLGELAKYDSSPEVNSFIMGGAPAWLDKETRVGLMNSTNIQVAAGVQVADLWFGGNKIQLPCNMIIKILAGIEIYALDCFNKTAEHRNNINNLTSIQEIIDYDFTQGYPEKLVIG